MIIYSGNKKITGGLLRTNHEIQKNDKTKRSDLSFFYTIQQQTGYNEDTDNPTFKDGKSKTVKLNRNEVGAILTTFLSSIGGGKITRWSGYHQGEDSSTAINFSYYHKTDESNSKYPKNIDMFTLNFSVGKDERYQVGISTGDMFLLMTEIQDALTKFAILEKEENDKERAAYAKNKSNSKSSASNTSSDDEPSDELSDENDDDVPF